MCVSESETKSVCVCVYSSVCKASLASLFMKIHGTESFLSSCEVPIERWREIEGDREREMERVRRFKGDFILFLFTGGGGCDGDSVCHGCCGTGDRER